jgi:hypothetical protein
MGTVSAVVYVSINYLSGGNVISDSVTACGLFIALYYGITGFACAWYYRKTLASNMRDLWMQGIIPVLGGLILFFAMGWSFYLDYKTGGDDYASYTVVHVFGLKVGGVAVIGVVAAVLGILVMILYGVSRPAYFRGQVLNKNTPTLLADEAGVLIGTEPQSPPGESPDAPAG